jgi:small subunit ribosomal protein S20
MAHHKSAQKRIRQSEERRLRNRSNLSTMKTAIRKVRDALTNNNLSNIDELMKEAQSVIAKTRRKGAIHKNNMARRISRLSGAVNKAKGLNTSITK